MAADVAAFAAAVDKVYGNFSAVDMQLDPKDTKRASERDRIQYLEQKFHEQLQRARAAFLQEFRNHSVVVECEVRKIREELTQKLEEKYGEKMDQLRRQNAESEVLIQKLKDEVAHLKGLVTSQESYLVAVRHQWAREDQGKQGAEIKQLRRMLEESAEKNDDVSHQLKCRDELVAQLSGELSTLESELKRQAGDFAQEKHTHVELVRDLQAEMKQQREQFESRMGSFQEEFEEYKAKSAAELKVQEILNVRRAEALRNMEEERLRLKKARTKPTTRIAIAPIENPMLGSAPAGDGAELEENSEARYEQYLLAQDTRYRVDDMGMDTAWRDYRLNDSQPVLPARKQAMPRFRVERVRKANSVGPHPPVATDDSLRPQHSLRPVPLRQMELAAPQSAR